MVPSRKKATMRPNVTGQWLVSPKPTQKGLTAIRLGFLLLNSGLLSYMDGVEVR